MTAWVSTFGLVFIFFVLFPALAQGLIMFAAAQAAGERVQNREYADRKLGRGE